MPKKYCIKLTSSERERLESVCRKQRVSAQKKLRARVFLFSDENREGGPLKDIDIAEKTGMAVSSIERLRKQCHEQGPEESLERKKRLVPPREIKVDGKLEAEITALACSDPPDGCARWTLQLLADRVVELGLVDSLSDESVRRALKKTGCSLTEANTGVSRRSRARRS
jgi:transposase